MNKKILVAIDGSRNSLAALDYINTLGRHCSDLQLVLFHVLPPVPPVYKEELFKDPIAQKYLLQWKEKHRTAIEQVLKKSKEKLLHWGWEDPQVQIKAQEKRVGLARDILFEAHNGLYDAVVLGRRGLTKVEEFFLGGVSSKVLPGRQGHTGLAYRREGGGLQDPNRPGRFGKCPSGGRPCLFHRGILPQQATPGASVEHLARPGDAYGSPDDPQPILVDERLGPGKAK